MKNIHVLPTPNTSRIISSNKEFTLLKNYTTDKRCQNIYITSDEEIKEESLTKEIYVIDIQNGNIGKLTCKNRFFKGSSKLIEIEWKNKQNIWNYNHIRKIILTTDQDLIKDGVQAIDDEFLEWFVKNPSCEKVTIDFSLVSGSFKYKIILPKEEYEYIGECKSNNGNGCFMDSSGHDCGCFIKIPKEEPKQESLVEKMIPLQLKYTLDMMKQETLEEVAIRFYKENKLGNVTQSFIEGARWQQERSYSEEEVELLLETLSKVLVYQGNDYRLPHYFEYEIEQVIKQFKKK